MGATLQQSRRRRRDQQPEGGGLGGITRLTTDDAAELAPTLTSTDNGKIIGPFDGIRVWLGKAYGFTDSKERYAVSPDMDSHSGAFTWKLFRNTRKGWQRLDTLNADGTRQDRG
jgi:hypothetical protein